MRLRAFDKILMTLTKYRQHAGFFFFFFTASYELKRARNKPTFTHTADNAPEIEGGGGECALEGDQSRRPRQSSTTTHQRRSRESLLFVGDPRDRATWVSILSQARGEAGGRCGHSPRTRPAGRTGRPGDLRATTLRHDRSCRCERAMSLRDRTSSNCGAVQKREQHLC